MTPSARSNRRVDMKERPCQVGGKRWLVVTFL